ncbi:MAG TPA: D-aminoacyl-tRNA deacylase [Candidatus Limnocylindrales bacterium]|nr:D-aminoacyl-tRNA deacylase [Candidatus Limnocylindrales bacterium]
MKTVLQRVSQAAVRVEGKIISEIGKGLVVLVGVEQEDSEKDATYLAEKILHLRIFEDEAGKMNLSVLDVHGSLLVVSQFTLLGDCRKGRRPSFTKAAGPELARYLYEFFIEELKTGGLPVATGIFQAHMTVQIFNDGPVTFILDSRS